MNGQRCRQSLDTGDWREAQSREKDRIGQVTAGKLAPANQQFARLAFPEAADRYLEARKLELSVKSLEKERQLLVKARDFFGASRVSQISSEDLEGYREDRNLSYFEKSETVAFGSGGHSTAESAAKSRTRPLIRGKTVAASDRHKSTGVAGSAMRHGFGLEHYDARVRTQRSPLARRQSPRWYIEH